MANKTTTAVASRKRRGRMMFVWCAAATVAVVTLIWTEQVALLYVLATLSVAALLVVVSLADLGEAKRATQAPPYDDSAAAGDAMNTAANSATRR
ncbi:MAG: hypothetical protein LC800_19650 [Acidobacteria bacterium]|nr:hypothetical protein [Acidobacteriota bacterium]